VYRAFLLASALLVLGCGKKEKDAPATADPVPQYKAPPPQDSGADRDPSAPRQGRGFPARLTATFEWARRDGVMVRVGPAGTFDGERLTVLVTVEYMGKDKPLQFANWTRPAQVTLKDDKGRTYPLLPLSAEKEKALRDAGEKRPPAYGSGVVTPNRPRYAMLEFDQAALKVGHLDLDLDGGPVGFTDPILFRIPGNALSGPKNP
jgi:hypothetical protein